MDKSKPFHRRLDNSKLCFSPSPRLPRSPPAADLRFDRWQAYKKSRSKDYIINYDASYTLKLEDKENKRPQLTRNLPQQLSGLARMSDPALNKHRLPATLPPRRTRQ